MIKFFATSAEEITWWKLDAQLTRANFITFSLLFRVSEKTLMLFIPCRSLTQNLHNSGIYVQYIMMIFCTSRYNHCFEPMVPPPITWSELLPSLTVYSWVHLASLVPSALPHCWLGKLGLLDPRNTLVWPWTNLWSPVQHPCFGRTRALFTACQITMLRCSLYWRGEYLLSKEIEVSSFEIFALVRNLMHSSCTVRKLWARSCPSP